MDKHEVADWIREYVGNLLGLDPSDVDVDVPFERYGLDSTAAVGLSGDLGKLLGLKLDANLVFHFPTISAVAEHVCAEAAAKAAS